MVLQDAELWDVLMYLSCEPDYFPLHPDMFYLRSERIGNVLFHVTLIAIHNSLRRHKAHSFVSYVCLNFIVIILYISVLYADKHGCHGRSKCRPSFNSCFVRNATT